MTPAAGAPGRRSRLAGDALAADRLQDLLKVFAPIVVGDLVARLDRLGGMDADRAAADASLGIRFARMVGVARDVAAVGAVDRPSVAEIEQILGEQPVGVVGAHGLAPVFDDERPLLDRRHRKQTEPSPGPADTEGLLRRFLVRRAVLAARGVFPWHATLFAFEAGKGLRLE